MLFSYGYYEMRAKLAIGDQLWQSFWACGFGDRNEVDVFETLAKTDGELQQNVHYWLEGEINSPEQQYPVNYAGAWDGNYHTYGLLWTAEKIVWYIDGQIVRTMDFTVQSFEKESHYGPLMNGKPMELIFGFSTGRGNSEVSEETLCKKMIVDYVRLYQHKQ